ncbi:hypothetical protein ACTWP6_27350 [Mycobacterium sp. 4D054]|uniref:hypothetical protein n=1 Tax=Mycobacterium sp. 4D054 TaxID=3457440 RepID=UPI003FD6537C
MSEYDYRLLHFTVSGFDRPRLLLEAWRLQLINVATLRQYARLAWYDCEFPYDALAAEEWRDIFDAAGFTDDGQPASPPESVRLFRGAPYQYRRGWAWSEYAFVALAYAKQQRRSSNGSGPAMLWTTVAPGSALLFVGDIHREYAVDTTDLIITPVGAAVDPDDYASYDEYMQAFAESSVRTRRW